MTITHGLCKLLGGDISVESEMGKGSTFSITIPANMNIDDQPLLGELALKEYFQDMETIDYPSINGRELVAKTIPLTRS